MRLTVLGCSGSLPGPASPASSYLLSTEHEGRTYSVLLDLGNGAFGALQAHLDPGEVDAVLLTHLHPDHCADLMSLYVWRTYHPEGTSRAPLPVYGPEGTGERLAQMYHAGGKPLASQFDVRPLHEGASFGLGPLTVTPVPMNHPVPAFGYRIEAGGRTLAYSGDTDSCAGLVDLVRGADVALLECAFVDGRDAARGIHLTGSRAGQAVADAGGVPRLVLTHLPPWNDPRLCLEQARSTWDGDIELAVPGATIDI